MHNKTQSKTLKRIGASTHSLWPDVCSVSSEPRWVAHLPPTRQDWPRPRYMPLSVVSAHKPQCSRVAVSGAPKAWFSTSGVI